MSRTCDVNEVDPLLPSDTDTGAVSADSLPAGALAGLFLFAIIDSISYVLVFPYIAALMEHVGTARRDISLYAGLAEGTLMITQALAAPLWVKAGARFGKISCVQLGILITLLPAIATGLCTTGWQVILCRLCVGLNPVNLFAQALLQDMTTIENRARAYSIYTPAATAGALLGSLIGGFAARPSEDGVLGGFQIFQRFPFLLPPVIYSALVITLLFISKRLMKDIDAATSTGRQAKAALLPATQTLPRTGLLVQATKSLSIPGLGHLLSISVFYEAAKYEWDGVYPVFAYTNTRFGGLGLHISTIGTVLAVGSLIYIAISFTLWTRILGAVGQRVLLPLTLTCFPILALSIPVSEGLALQARPLLTGIVAAQVALRMVGRFSTQMIDASIMSLFQDHPELSTMGSALKIMAGAGGRAVGPVAAGFLFSRSRMYPANTLGHAMGWLGIFVFALPMVILSIRMSRRLAWL